MVMNNKEAKFETGADFSTKRFVAKFWSLLKPSKKTIHKIVFWTVLLESARLFAPYILKIIIDTITNFKAEDLWLLLGLSLALLLANQFVSLLTY